MIYSESSGAAVKTPNTLGKKEKHLKGYPMNKTRYLAAFIFSLLIFFVGCSFGQNPKEVISKYLENYSHGNYDKAYEYLSSKDKAVKSQQEFSGDFKEFGVFAKAFAEKTTFNIKEVKITGEKALATVDVTAPDLSGAMGELFGAVFQEAMKSSFSGGKADEKEMEKIVVEKMKDKNLPTTTRSEQYDLVKDKDGWRVYMGWENAKHIEELKAAAKKLDEQKKFDESKAKYSEILTLSSRDDEAPQKIKELDEKIVKYREKQAYFPNIEVRNVRIGKSTLNDTGVFGELKNNGDRSLKRVEVTIYYLDKDGKAIFEKDYSPVLVSEYSFGLRRDKPLKPNYSQQFGCKLDDAPSDWSGEIRVKVTNLEFE
jgi:2'-5' RNA ligase